MGRAWERLGNLAAPTCQRLPSRLPQSPVVWLDDTGWRVGAQPQNLRVLLSEQVTVYLIEPHRGYAEAAAILGEDYAGFLVHDGARCFYGLEQALHPSCLEHLIRRCREMIRMASPAAARFPLAVRRLLQQGLELRDRYRQGSLSGHGLGVATGRLEARLDRLLDGHFPRFCVVPVGRPPTMWPSRPSGRWWWPARPGVATAPGTAPARIRAQRAPLASVLRTCWQQGKDAFRQLVNLLRSPDPVLLEIVAAAQSP